MTRREPEWRLEDVALLEAQIEKQKDLGPHGQPMTEALDSDTDPNNPNAPYLYEPYYYVDHAAQTLRYAQERFRKDHGDDADRDLVWGLTKKPRTPAPVAG